MNNQLFDFISKDDCAKAYYHLGVSGKNKSDYFIGSGKPMTLHQFFNEFSKETQGKNLDWFDKQKNEELLLAKENFDNSELINHTGFVPNNPKFNFTY